MVEVSDVMNNSTTVRALGPEPGLQYANAQNLCQFGSYTRRLNSNLGGTCPNFLKLVDTWLLDAIPTGQTGATEAFTLLPYADVAQYQIGTARVGSAMVTVFDITNPAYQKYIFEAYFPNIFLPHLGKSAYGHVPSVAQPVYVGIDSFNIDFNWVTFDAGVNMSPGEWYAGWGTFFQYALANRPEIRLHPHMSGLSDWSVFQGIYQYVPGQMKEHFNIGSAPKMGTYERGQLNNQIVNTFWFANEAPPLFRGDPPTRVVTWGTDIGNGDVHSALALYCLVRGPNTFFELLSGSSAADPSEWEPACSILGLPIILNPPQVVATGKLGSLYKRQYSHGAAYFNLTGSAQAITVPTGSVKWDGITPQGNFTLADGKGEVVLTP